MEKKKSMMKKYTPEEIEAMDRKADLAVGAMMATAIGIGAAPVGVDIVATSTAMGAGVVAIGKCYAQELTKDDAADLIKQFFKAAGMAYSMMYMGMKITDSVLKSNPVTYVPFMVADSIVNGAASFAIGTTAKNFFRRRAEGKKVSKAEMKQWMKEGQKKGKTLARKAAQEQAAKEQIEKKKMELEKAEAEKKAQAETVQKAAQIKAKMDQDIAEAAGRSAWQPGPEKGELTKGSAQEARRAVKQAGAKQAAAK